MQPSADTVWGAAQQQLRAMLNTDIFNLWFLPIKATALEGDVITLEVANDFCEVWLKDNYLGLIHDVLLQSGGQSLKVKFRVNSSGAPGTGIQMPDAKTKARVATESTDRNGAP